jgi:membrane-associated phospholipid phosphatase
MVQALCTSGNCERLKSGVHGAAVVIAGVMAAYNIAACCFRRDRHLRINAIVYTLAVGFEIRQTLHHLRHTSPAAAGTADRPFASAKCA